MTQERPQIIGPVLFLDDAREGQLFYAALFIAAAGVPVDALGIKGQSITPDLIAEFANDHVYRARFSVPMGQGFEYFWAGETFEVATGFEGDLRVGYASCNGEEHGDLERLDAERNLMWARMRQDHARAPLSLLLHGGDQVYADEVTDEHPLSLHWPSRFEKDLSEEELASLKAHFREGFLERYKFLYAAPDLAWLAARVPSLMQWDDHDICDGWGSLKRSRTESEVGQSLFAAAREACLLFQHAAVDGDLPARFADPSGAHLGWQVHLPDLHIIAPDLRGQRTRRDVMGPAGWRFTEAALDHGSGDTVFLMSSVPVLGPRLSVFETIMTLIPRMQKYEDDLRDQWQSRAHRTSWKRILRSIKDAAQKRRVIALSGEIHLATRGEMPVGRGRVFHQLVSSGVTHRPPPRKWARLLGAIATWGDAPLQGCRISIRRLPGQYRRYVAERNTLRLAREEGSWSASWDLENSGTTPELNLD